MCDPGGSLGCHTPTVWFFFYKGFSFHLHDEPGNLPVREPLGQGRQDKCSAVAGKALYRPGVKRTLLYQVLLSMSCPGIAVLRSSQKPRCSATLPILSSWLEGAELFWCPTCEAPRQVWQFLVAINCMALLCVFPFTSRCSAACITPSSSCLPLVMSLFLPPSPRRILKTARSMRGHGKWPWKGRKKINHCAIQWITHKISQAILVLSRCMC